MTADDLPIAYVPDQPRMRETPEQLRARIPGWGADLDPADRPSHPKLRYAPEATGARWRFPERHPGWGPALAPPARPSHPKLRYAPEAPGARWRSPERRPGAEGRERSIEHAFVTPVFGPAQPLHGASGAIRRLAYRRFSEGRN